MIETDVWPFIEAHWYTKVDRDTPRAVRLLVIHDMEFPETMTAAEDVARYFATTNTKASAHVCIDADSVVQCVLDRHVAYAAPGCNHDGIQLELAGYANQSASQWDDAYSRQLLDRAANVAAQYCCKFSIPPRQLTNAELLAGASGIIGHDQASAVYHQSTHTDPGPAFPWAAFVAQVHMNTWARMTGVR